MRDNGVRDGGRAREHGDRERSKVIIKKCIAYMKQNAGIFYEKKNRICVFALEHGDVLDARQMKTQQLA